MTRPLIFIADLLQAIDKLEVDSPQVARSIMRMLSLESWPESASAPQSPAEPESASTPRPVFAPPDSVDIHRVAGPKSSADLTRGHRGRAAVTQVEAAPAGFARPAWALDAAAMPRPLGYPATEPESLLGTRQERTLVACLAATPDHEGSIDVDKLVAQLANGEPLRDIPRLPGFSLRRGLQVLVDQGAGMAPFERDVQQLLGKLRVLVPSDRLYTAGFEGSPLRGCRVSGKKRRPWQACAPGTPVLLLTELGIAHADDHGRPADAPEWQEFAKAAQTAGVHLRTLVPYPPERWPGQLAARLRCMQWDRRTTAAQVRRVLAVGLA